MDYTEKLVKHINGYHGLITETNLDCVLLTNGQQVYREVVEHPGGVAVIPVDENGDVYCVRQFRYPFSEHLLEVPASESGWARMVTREIEVTYPEHRFISVYAMPLNEEGLAEKGVLVILRDVTRDRRQEASTLESERSNAIKLLAAGVARAAFAGSA